MAKIRKVPVYNVPGSEDINLSNGLSVYYFRVPCLQHFPKHFKNQWFGKLLKYCTRNNKVYRRLVVWALFLSFYQYLWSAWSLFSFSLTFSHSFPVITWAKFDDFYCFGATCISRLQITGPDAEACWVNWFENCSASFEKTNQARLDGE